MPEEGKAHPVKSKITVKGAEGPERPLEGRAFRGAWLGRQRRGGEGRGVETGGGLSPGKRAVKGRKEEVDINNKLNPGQARSPHPGHRSCRDRSCTVLH